ncbi:UDP-N-acetylmuramate dehydrogenase [Spongiibacter sp. KMU-158]|uniref:UDP-N-acetylenolpyruvoylglucosamine reductase n=1 Tax=Spongiibacter pelagi TaxID=2760804 RepID=A0A927C3D1_9GAMM|nr:UDP-N-acetylmuramate dehydrogenase [Spongiibacter pelagi]
MPEIREQVDLQPFNTLSLPVWADYFCTVHDTAELKAALGFVNEKQLPVCLLGGGSNSVFKGDFPGLVIQIALKGITCEEQGTRRLVSVAAGENWDHFVRHCLHSGWYGIENLIAIPGSVGAAPIQNIGAYGVELSACLHSVTGVHIDSLQEQTLSAAECELGYRDSVFKNRLRDKFVITEISLELSSDAQAQLQYPALKEALPDHYPPTPELVAQTVEVVRASKLPDPATEPNAGSFFKNPIIDVEQAEQLLKQFPDLPHWPIAEGKVSGKVKLAAAWLVQHCGWKGRRMGPVGVHPKQAIVLVNYEGGSAAELLALATAIQQEVFNTFSVSLDIEPRVY